MIRIIFIFIFIKSTLLGCSLCTIYSPITKASIDIKASDDIIKTANITWALTKEFTEQLKQIYDKNQNNFLDKKELIPVERSLLDYIEEKNYLTHISYDKVINKENSNDIIINKYKTYIKDSILHFDYEIKLDYKVIKDNILYINIHDDENYFVLLLEKNSIKFDAPFKVSKVLNRNDIAFYIHTSNTIKNNQELTDTSIKSKEVVKQKKEESFLSDYSNKVKEYLLKIEQGNNLALFILLGISFLYGVIHALGPGHGKSLAFSYFLSNKSSYLKAFIISQASAFIHIIGALILVVISIFILQSVLNNFVNDSIEILTKVSALMIIALAVYIFFNKLKNKNCSCCSCSTTNNTNQVWGTVKPKKQNILKPNFMKKDLYFVLTSGLIPCPGTVILFIYAFILKTYLAVFLAAIFISLGMGLVIFISSFFAISLNKVSEKSHTITNILEFLSPVIMFFLGILLYLNANII
ncbi:MAG: DUF1007 family protein [Arcobacter sp.]|nr:DUF1007 family protein [Arcobacter sp.]